MKRTKRSRPKKKTTTPTIMVPTVWHWDPQDKPSDRPRTIYELKVGDIVVSRDDEERMVLEVLTQSCLLSFYDIYNRAHAWYTFKQLEEYGYTIKGEKPTTFNLSGKYTKEQLKKMLEK